MKRFLYAFMLYFALSFSLPAHAEDPDTVQQIIENNLAQMYPKKNAQKAVILAAGSANLSPLMRNEVPAALDLQTERIAFAYQGTFTRPFLGGPFEIGGSNDDRGKSLGLSYRGDGYRIHVGRFRQKSIPNITLEQPVKNGLFFTWGF